MSGAGGRSYCSVRWHPLAGNFGSGWCHLVWNYGHMWCHLKGIEGNYGACLDNGHQMVLHWLTGSYSTGLCLVSHQKVT